MPRPPRDPAPIPDDAPEPAAADDAPQPAPLRFYGTCWVDRSRGYALRRLGLGVAALLLAVAGAAVLVLLFAGVSAAWLQVLVVLTLALATAMAFVRTWGGYTGTPDRPDAPDESAFRSIKVVGFVGVLLAYALRTTVEAPGERLRRAELDAARERHQRTTRRRSGNPARRRAPGRRRQGRP